jgi:ABC-2 type transport system ATP-binding protein
VIEVKELTKFYGDRKVLHEINFKVEKGSVCGFLGPNGSGKSTTMDILAGLLGPSQGEVTVCGYNVVTQEKDVKAHIGYLSDNPPLYKEMTVRDFLLFVAKLRKIDAKARKSACDTALTSCDLLEVQHRVIGHLSKGFRQRVALCSALIHNPDVLILDEPTEGLDPNQIVQIRNLIKKLSLERTVILSSHILPEVQAACSASQISLSANDLHTKFEYAFAPTDALSGPLDWFKKQSFIKNVSQGKTNSLLVEYALENLKPTPEDLLSRVAKELIEQNFKVCTIQTRMHDIEDLFFRAINSETDNERSVTEGREV